MNFLMSFLSLIFIGSSVLAENCPQGGDIYSKGISSAGEIDVINSHNYYRLQIAIGNITNQPKGINLLRMSFDSTLALKGRPVSDSCTMEHIIAEDDRWGWVGQNLYIEWSSEYSEGQNWASVVKSWFDENVDFIYPNSKTSDSSVVGHYTQVVWATSYMVGCDFIHFYDENQPSYPYAKLYTCNYGPGGNIMDEAPYLTGESGCENLCDS